MSERDPNDLRFRPEDIDLSRPTPESVMTKEEFERQRDEERRYEIGKTVLASLVVNIADRSFTNPDFPSVVAKNMVENYAYAAAHAQRYADALLFALKRKPRWEAAPTIIPKEATEIAKAEPQPNRQQRRANKRKGK